MTDTMTDVSSRPITHSARAKQAVTDYLVKIKDLLPIERQRLLDDILDAATKGQMIMSYRASYPGLHDDLSKALRDEGYVVVEASGAMTISWGPDDVAEPAPIAVADTPLDTSP